MFKFISKPNRIKYVADLLPFTNYSKRTTSILPTFQLQSTLNYSSIKYYSSAAVPVKRIATEISSNVDHECTVFKEASKLFNSDSSKELSTIPNQFTNNAKKEPTLVRKRAIDIIAAVDLSKYRNGNIEDPGLNVTALVKNYFHEKNVATATHKELFQYITKLGFYATLSDPDKKILKKAISRVLTRNPGCFRNERRGSWSYLNSLVLSSFRIEKSRDVTPHEDREYESQVFLPDKDFLWNEKSFKLYGYMFCLRNSRYAKCSHCELLFKIVKKYNKRTGNKIEIPKLGALRINDDGSVEGCPWKPSNKKHFCLQDQKIRKTIKESKNRLDQFADEFLKLHHELEKIYSSSSSQFKLNNIKNPLKSFLDQFNKIYPYSSSQKIAFLYFLRYVDNPSEIIYYGVTYDYYHRFCDHIRDDKKFISDREFEMLIAPLGQRNMLFVKELEAVLIRMSKKNLLNDGNSIINIRLGHIASENGIYNDLDFNDDDFCHDVTHALNQLITLTLKHGSVIKKVECLTSQIKSISQRIMNARSIFKGRFQRLESFQDSSDKSSVMNYSSLFSPCNINIMPAELISFLCEIETIHEYTRNQKAAYLYFLKYPNDASVKRYGITTNPLKRYGHQKRVKILQGEIFEMIIAPVGQRSILFVEDLEALLIRFSKMKLLNDGKACENDNYDDGKFHSKYNVFHAIVDQEKHPRRPFIIKALNQLIEFTLRSNVTVESFSKSK